MRSLSLLLVLGLALWFGAKALRDTEEAEGRGRELAMTLDGYPDRTPAQEMAILTGIAGGDAPFPDLNEQGKDPQGPFKASWSGGNGMKIRARSQPGSRKVTLDIEGFAHVDSDALKQLVGWLAGEIDGLSERPSRDAERVEKQRGSSRLERS